ncbi:MAG: preprotein translocase subunit SecG [Phycisphaerales bacterium]|nr:preprotein translocase subunit SecG [Phycisphaerales bacterium]
MITVFIILVVLVSLILCFIVLIQNPQGGGLSGSIAGFNNQFMGVKQTTDVLEKGTWLFVGILAFLCLTSIIFLKNAKNVTNQNDIELLQKLKTAPVNTLPNQGGAMETVPQTK